MVLAVGPIIGPDQEEVRTVPCDLLVELGAGGGRGRDPLRIEDLPIRVQTTPEHIEFSRPVVVSSVFPDSQVVRRTPDDAGKRLIVEGGRDRGPVWIQDLSVAAHASPIDVGVKAVAPAVFPNHEEARANVCDRRRALTFGRRRDWYPLLIENDPDGAHPGAVDVRAS